MAKTRAYLKTLVAARIDEVIAEGSALENQNMAESPIETIEDELDNAADYILMKAPIERLFQLIVSDKKFHHGVSVNDEDVRVIFKTDYSGHIPLPADLFRFVSVKMSDWTRSATELVPYSGNEYKELLNEHTSGSYVYPKVALVPWNTYTSGENTPYTLDKTFTSNTTLTTLFDGETVDSYAMSTGDLLFVSGNTTDRENGLYVCPASGILTYADKIAEPYEVLIEQRKAALEFYKCRSNSATLEELFYIPRTKAHEMPDELVDALCWVCAWKAFQMLRMPDFGKIALGHAEALL